MKNLFLPLLFIFLAVSCSKETASSASSSLKKKDISVTLTATTSDFSFAGMATAVNTIGPGIENIMPNLNVNGENRGTYADFSEDDLINGQVKIKSTEKINYLVLVITAEEKGKVKIESNINGKVKSKSYTLEEYSPLTIQIQ